MIFEDPVHWISAVLSFSSSLFYLVYIFYPLDCVMLAWLIIHQQGELGCREIFITKARCSREIFRSWPSPTAPFPCSIISVTSRKALHMTSPGKMGISLSLTFSSQQNSETLMLGSTKYAASCRKALSFVLFVEMSFWCWNWAFSCFAIYYGQK